MEHDMPGFSRCCHDFHGEKKKRCQVRKFPNWTDGNMTDIIIKSKSEGERDREERIVINIENANSSLLLAHDDHG